MDNKVHILIIEDDKLFCAFITASLRENGYKVTPAFTGKEGLSLAASHRPDVILLDLGLPDMDGYEILKLLRNWNQIPILVLSAKTQESDKVLALDLGADDYITKPPGLAELRARIRTGLRHCHINMIGSTYKALDLEINFDRRLVILKGEDIHLTQIEYQLLSLLAKNSGHVLTYGYLMKAIWGPYTDNNNQILRVNMANIRRKIERAPSRPLYIFTESGIGYRMRDNESR